MDDVAVRVENLSKRYRIGEKVSYRALRDEITRLFTAPFKKSKKGSTGEKENGHILALKDVSFEVKRGEVLGIIGRNGAGKTTLLKILSRITEPTEGYAEVHGRVGSLLEVGTGFHPELTGRENIYLNGSILGMKKAEIDRKFDEMVAFAELKKFIDTPVKYYSSGMYVRRAFAVAAHLEPEILLVDEVLAVGDFAFQKKCLGKMENIAGEGRTVLFVSHNMSAIQQMCKRVILIDQGRIIDDGESLKVVNRYLGNIFSNVKTEQVWEDKETAPGGNRVRLRRACVRPEDGVPTDTIYVTTPIVLEFEYWNLIPDVRLNLTVALFNEDGVFVFASVPLQEPVWDGKPFPASLFKTTCHIPGAFLNNGVYFVRMQIVEDHMTQLFVDPEVVIFEVYDSVEMRSKHGGWQGKWLGVVRPDLKWTTEMLKS